MRFQNVIGVRRDGLRHTESELRELAAGAANGDIPDYQLAAWLMAAYLNPLDDEETAWLTQAIAESGERVDLTGLPKPWFDKHSTGGVGDKTSIILLPILAACGMTVLKMSGHGLGTTGGTLDKLESIPGFRVDLDIEELKSQAKRIGVAITGQSPNLAPADKALYALRDVTGTVASIPLLVSSILSKKIAGGAETILLDVKSGSGGFMRTAEGALDLAAGLARTAKTCGLDCHLALTDMTQPLGSVGNAVEIEESLAILRNQAENAGQERVRELIHELAGIALASVHLVQTPQEGREMARSVIESGKALAKAEEWFAAQGGSIDAALPTAPVQRTIKASQTTYIAEIDAESVGVAVIAMGGGRRRKDDLIDSRVGVKVHVAVGSAVKQGEPLFTICAADEAMADRTERLVLGATSWSDAPVEKRPVVIRVF